MRASVKEWMVRGAAFCGSWLREEWATLLSVTVGTALTCFALVALVVPYKFAGVQPVQELGGGRPCAPHP